MWPWPICLRPPSGTGARWPRPLQGLVLASGAPGCSPCSRRSGEDSEHGVGLAPILTLIFTTLPHPRPHPRFARAKAARRGRATRAWVAVSHRRLPPRSTLRLWRWATLRVKRAERRRCRGVVLGGLRHWGLMAQQQAQGAGLFARSVVVKAILARKAKKRAWRATLKAFCSLNPNPALTLALTSRPSAAYSKS